VRIPADVRAELERRGHVIRVLPDYSWVVGVDRVSPATRHRQPRRRADPRRDGYAIGVVSEA